MFSEAPAKDPQPAWYVIQCRANQNQRAQANLENQGFTCFHPQLNVEKLRAGRRVTRLEPLFPGYLFIQLCEQSQSWYTIRSTRGVQKLVAFGQYPLPVPDDVIDSLRHAQSANDNPNGNTHAKVPAINPGDRLRIESGPFASLEGVFKRFDGQERVVVLLGLLQKQHELKLAVKDIRRL